jgi:hypothetical protein
MPQTARPISSFAGSGGSWTINGAANVVTALSDELDSTYISAVQQKANYGQLSALVDPVIHTGHVIRVREQSGSGTGQAVANLFQGDPTLGGTQIAGAAVSESGTPTEWTLTLSEAQAANITDYTNLWWEITRGSGTFQGNIIEWRFEVPTAGPSPVSDSAVATESAVVTSPNLKVTSQTGSASDSASKTITSLYPGYVGNYAHYENTSGGGARQHDYCQNGVWWLVIGFAGGTRWLYSTDQGVTWTARTTMDFNPASYWGHDNLMSYAFFIDADDNLHLVATHFLTAVGTYVSYFLGTPTDGTRTNYNWTNKEGPIFLGDWSGGDIPDIIAYRNPSTGGWDAWYSCSLLSGGYWYTYVLRTQLNSSGNNIGTSGYTPLGYLNGQWRASLDFRHTAADPKLVQSATPSVYALYVNNAEDISPFSQRWAYSGGSWTDGGYVNLDASYGAAFANAQLEYDGTRIIIAYTRVTSGVRQSTPLIIERDEANTATTTRFPTDPAGGAIQEGAFNLDSAGNISLYVAGATTNALKRNIFNRGAGTWGGWTTVVP